jgi:hypothetical protein
MPFFDVDVVSCLHQRASSSLAHADWRSTRRCMSNPVRPVRRSGRISTEELAMTKYLISFPSRAMVVPDGEWQAVADAAHAVIRQAQDAGVYVFGGGIDEDVATVVVAGDGRVTPGVEAGARGLDGGFTVLELPTREAALEWARRIAVACRCAQELQQFQYDPLC